jgi:hypothetical protein
MNALFERGYGLGKNGYHWAKVPPDYQELEAAPFLPADSGRAAMMLIHDRMHIWIPTESCSELDVC